MDCGGYCRTSCDVSSGQVAKCPASIALLQVEREGEAACVVVFDAFFDGRVWAKGIIDEIGDCDVGLWQVYVP